MRPIRLFSLLACSSFLFAAAAGCQATIAGEEDTAGSDTGSEAGDGGGDGGLELPCSADDPCPDGQFCFNGLCAIGCQTNDNCADDQYCDTEWSMTCQNKSVPTCSTEAECAGDQICVNGVCSTPPPDTACNPEDYLNDGCSSDSVCLEVTEQAKCYTMPPCGEDGSCPVGSGGATCNEDYLPNKDRICLLGACVDESECPADWNCIRFNDNDPIGGCSNGAFGSPCNGPEDCESNNCFEIPGLGGGVCM